MSVLDIKVGERQNLCQSSLFFHFCHLKKFIPCVRMTALCAYVYVSDCIGMCGHVYLVWGERVINSEKKKKKTPTPPFSRREQSSMSPSLHTDGAE